MLNVVESLSELHETDETAWLDRMADLAREGRTNGMDLAHLAEFLTDMSRRDRREVTSRLEVLISHLLKWSHQPSKRSRSRIATILTQSRELEIDLRPGTLRDFAETELASTYEGAVLRASAETGIPRAEFPAECPYTVEELITLDPDRFTL